jgi:hypothetical protein
MSNNFEFVARPAVPSDRVGPRSGERTRALLDTADNKQAIRVPINGANVATLQGQMRQACYRNGLGFHYHRDGDSLICWATRKDVA